MSRSCALFRNGRYELISLLLQRHSIRKFMVASQFLQVLKCFEPPNGMREEVSTEAPVPCPFWKVLTVQVSVSHHSSSKSSSMQSGKRPTLQRRSEKAGNRRLDLVSGNLPLCLEREMPALTQNSKTALSEDEAAVNHLLPESNPTSGPSFPTIPFEEDFAASSSATVPPPKSIFAPDFRHLQNPDRQDSASSSSGAWSTVATPGLRDEDDGQSSLLATAATISRDVSPEAIGREIIDVDADQGEPVKKGVRFAGPDGAPLSPASTLLTLDSYAAPEGPPPSERDTSPTTAKAPSVPAIMSNTQPAPSAPYLPHPAPGGLSSAPQPPLQLNYVTPRAIPPPPPQSLDSKAIESCQKHAKWAISALDYEDL